MNLRGRAAVAGVLAVGGWTISGPVATAIGTPTTTLSATTSTPLAPPVDLGLASRIPAVDGYSIAEVPADDLLWADLDNSLPAELTRHHTFVVDGDGVPVARLVVAATASDRPAIDSFVEHTFAAEVMLPVDAEEMDGGTMIVSNSAAPVWTELEGNAVIVAEQEIDGNFQWAWGADDLVWVVRGTGVAEDYVRALLRSHAVSLDPYDQQGMTGDLFDHTPSVPGFMYWDMPRAITLREVSQTLLGECVERFYVGYVLPDGVSRNYGQDDLGLALMKAAGWCVEDGLLEDVVAELASRPGARTEQIGGLTVYRDEHTIIALIGDVVVLLVSGNPQTLVDMTSFIEPYLTAQPR
jgi:hypothetical protein